MNQILQGDCLELFHKVEDESVDMAFADPPFNLNKKYSGTTDNLNSNAYLAWCFGWINEMLRVLKPGGTLFLHNIPKWLVSYSCYLERKANFRHWIAWDAATSPMGVSLQPAHYGILYFTKCGKHKVYELRVPHKRCRDYKCNKLLKDYGGKKHTIHPFGPLASDVWTDIFRVKHDRYRDNHPCQLPTILLERLVLLCTDVGEVVLDPFMGTGTTAIAAKRLGRNYIGFEQSSEYVDIANSKLNKEREDSFFNGIWASCYSYPKPEHLVTIRDCDIWNKKTKVYNEKFIDLFENWPEDDDGRKSIDFKHLTYKKDIREKLKRLC